MDDQQALKSAQETYVRLAMEFWTILKNEGARQANRKTEEADIIIEQWAAVDAVHDFLSPLLSHNDEAVRCGAAVHLLKFGAPVEATLVLKSIAKYSSSLVGSTARLALMTSCISNR